VCFDHLPLTYCASSCSTNRLSIIGIILRTFHLKQKNSAQISIFSPNQNNPGVSKGFCEGVCVFLTERTQIRILIKTDVEIILRNYGKYGS
jgi:hypothetical protein